MIDFFLSEVCSPNWDAEQNRGRPYSAGIALLTENYPQYSSLIADYDSHWADMIRGAVPGIEEIIHEAACKRIPLYAISNCPAEKYPDVARALPVVNSFADVIISGEVGCIKPEKAIYRLALDRFELSAHECVFVDDSALNVAAAIEVGMAGIVFKDSNDLRHALAEYLSL